MRSTDWPELRSTVYLVGVRRTHLSLVKNTGRTTRRYGVANTEPSRILSKRRTAHTGWVDLTRTAAVRVALTQTVTVWVTLTQTVTVWVTLTQTVTVRVTLTRGPEPYWN